MNRKSLFILILAIVLMVLALGTSYAFFNYTKVSSKSHTMVVGDVYLTYN